MKAKIVVYTSVGVFESKVMEKTSEEIDSLKSYIKENINEMNYLNVDAEDGTICIPASILNASVIEIVVQE